MMIQRVNPMALAAMWLWLSLSMAVMRTTNTRKNPPMVSVRKPVPSPTPGARVGAPPFRFTYRDHPQPMGMNASTTWKRMRL